MDRPYSPWTIGLALTGLLLSCSPTLDTMAAPPTLPDAPSTDTGCVPLPETCDGFDQDCDGAIDNAPAPVVSDRIIDEGAVGGRGRPGLAWSTVLSGYLISDMHEPQVGMGAACPAVVGVTRDGIVGDLHTDLVGGTGGGCRNARFVPLSTARCRLWTT